MNVDLLITEAVVRGAGLRVQDGRLQIRGARRLPAELRQTLRDHEASVVDALEHPAELARDGALHACACGKAIPYTWHACTACDPAWRESRDLPARIGTLYRAVGRAWDRLLPAERPEALHQALRTIDAVIQDAYTRRDWGSLEKAITQYEATAAPIFVGYPIIFRASGGRAPRWPLSTMRFSQCSPPIIR